MKDKVSVVIPTRRRPHLILRAVKSALAQTYDNIEVIVVLDGPDETTLPALGECRDPRVRARTLPEHVGPSEARNAGVREAEGPWIAFLDDDDEWLPLKLEKQVRAAGWLNTPLPVIACCVIHRTPSGDSVQPIRMPGPGEPVGDYLFTRPSFFGKEGVLQTSTLLMKKALLEKVPFRREVVPHEDQDLLLRAAGVEGVRIEVVPEPLSIWHIRGQGENLSAGCNWKYSMDWLRENRGLLTARARAGFVATTVADQASRQREWKAFLPLFREMRRFGAPGPGVCLLYLVMWLVPMHKRQRIRAALGRVLPGRAGRQGGSARPLRVAVAGIRGFPRVMGGIETHAENLYPRLAAMGCEVTVYARKPYVDPRIREHEGVRLVPLPCVTGKHFEAFIHTFCAVLAARLTRPDILHIHAVGPSLFAPMARLLGMKVVMTHHGPDYERRKWGRFAKFVLRTGERLGSRWAHGLICISDPIAEMVKVKYGRDPEVIPNGVDIPAESRIKGNLRKYGAEEGKYIFAVGRFVPEKGFHDLIEAFGLITRRESGSGGRGPSGPGENWKLLIAGDATHEDAYSLGLKAKAAGNDRIILAGFLSGDALAEAYANAGMFVLPSCHEGLPIALLEAMSHGLSCIVSDIPANRNVGLTRDRYFRAGDVRGLAAKLEQFMGNPLPSEERLEQVRLVEERFAWGSIAAKTLEIYRGVCSRGLP